MNSLMHTLIGREGRLLIDSSWKRATIVAIAVVMAAAACERSTPLNAWTHVAPDVAHIALYNRGTKLLGGDSLTAALPPLDSAMASKDTTVMFRAAFNGGWDYLVNGIRTIAILKKGGPEADSILAVIARDSVLRSASAHSDAAAYVNMQLDSSLAKYRSALVTDPNDLDAKWNYELALRISKGGGGGTGKGKGRDKMTNKGGGQSKQRKENPNQASPIDKMSLQQQRAEQLLNAVERQEQQSLRAVPVQTTPPPQGKDW
jgi:hypothetical protein